MFANCRSHFLLDRLGRYLKLIVSSESILSWYEFASQFGLEFVSYAEKTTRHTFIFGKAARLYPMSYRNVRFLEYVMTNAINYKCGFACDSKPAGLPVTENPKRITQWTYISWRILGRGDHKT